MCSGVGDSTRDGSTTDVLRREVLKYAGLGSGAAVASLLADKANAAATPREQGAQAAAERGARGMPSPIIKNIGVIEIPGLLVVKVTTDQDGLYGYGEATVGLAGRSKAVRAVIEQYLKPLMVGRAADRIEENWQLCYFSSYYKNDHVQNAAMSGICDALWDIKGRQLGVPVYQLVGGKVREAAEVYAHARARPLDPKQVVENSKKLVAQGYRNIQVDVFGSDAPVKALNGRVGFDRALEVRKIFQSFEAFRKEMPADIRLGCDVHSMLDATRAVRFCKDAKQFGPWYWVEDVIPPEEQMFFRVIRQQSAMPLSIGELWNNPHEWRPLIEERLVDYIRNHISHIGGFTAARKVAALAENFQVRTGWHGSNDISPVGQMARLTLDVTTTNFGIHEDFGPFPDQIKGIFQGGLEVRDGYAWVSEKPGWGIEIDEAAAAKLPQGMESNHEHRLADGSVFLGIG